MITSSEIYCLNEIGKRANNEDRICPWPGEASEFDKVYIVCDGVGGEKDGEVASEIVCQSIYNYLNRIDYKENDWKPALSKAIHYAGLRLAEHARANPGSRRMSTTLSLAFLGEKSVIAAWCGDSRIHHIRNGQILWQSEDHSLVQELVNRGEISLEEASFHPNRNIITRSLNALNSNNEVDFHEIHNIQNGDYILLCSDGFLEQVDAEVLQAVLNNDRVSDKASEFNRICEGRTRDNYSMYLLKVSGA